MTSYPPRTHARTVAKFAVTPGFLNLLASVNKDQTKEGNGAIADAQCKQRPDVHSKVVKSKAVLGDGVMDILSQNTWVS